MEPALGRDDPERAGEQAPRLYSVFEVSTPFGHGSSVDALLAGWPEASLTTLGFFRMAFWAFCLGYLISAKIQVFVTERRMQRAMAGAGVRSVALGTLFGFL